MKTIGVLIIATFTILIASQARADEFCNWRPRDVDTAFDIRNTTLLLSTRHDTYGIYNDCVTIVRRQFGTVLNFAVVNRFPADIGIKSGYILVKSVRLLSSQPLIKLSLSRGGGWYLPAAGSSLKSAPEMNYQPFRGTIETWNAAHSKPGGPADFAQRLGASWHAYATQDMSLASSDAVDFWKVGDGFDRVHGVITNYLMRFDVNTGTKLSTVPFKVFLQKQVQQIELHIVSSIDSLSGDYKFIVR